MNKLSRLLLIFSVLLLLLPADVITLPCVKISEAVESTVEELCKRADSYTEKSLSSDSKKKSGRYALLALKTARNAKAADPDSPLPHISMARAYVAQGNSDEALEAVQQALELDPGNTEAQKLFKELGGKVAEMQKPTRNTQTVVYENLDKWEILDGNWYVKDGEIYGSGGTIKLNDAFRAYIMEITVEHISGPSNQGVGIGMRGNVIQGGSKRFRNNSSDIQGYAFNFTFSKTYNLFNGIGGSWYLIKPEWKKWQHSNQLGNRVNKIRVEASENKFNVFINNEPFTDFSGNTHAEGSPYIWIQDPAQIIRFSNIKIIQK